MGFYIEEHLFEAAKKKLTVKRGSIVIDDPDAVITYEKEAKMYTITIHGIPVLSDTNIVMSVGKRNHVKLITSNEK